MGVSGEEQYPGDGTAVPQYRYAEYYPGDITEMQVGEILGEYTTVQAAAMDESLLPDSYFRFVGLEERISYLPFTHLDLAEGLLETAAASSDSEHRLLAGGTLAYTTLSGATRVLDETERKSHIQRATALWAELSRDPALYVSCYDSFYRKLLLDTEYLVLLDRIALSDVRGIMLPLQAKYLANKARIEQAPTTDPDMARAMLVTAISSKDIDHRRLAAGWLAPRLLQADTYLKEADVRKLYTGRTIALWDRLANDSDPSVRELAYAGFYLDFLSDNTACSRVTLAEVQHLVMSLEPEDAGR